MVIVDTSVWVRALAKRQPYEATLSQLLEQEVVLGHDLVYGELLIGDAGARAKLLSQYERYKYAATVPHRDVVNFVRAHRSYGEGLSWVDAHLLAAALVERARLYTADHALTHSARRLGVLFET